METMAFTLTRVMMFTLAYLVVMSGLLQEGSSHTSPSISIRSTGGLYPDGCIRQSHTKILCDGIIPQYVPNKITEIDVIDLPQEQFIAKLFCNCSWKNVIQLSMLCKDTCENKLPMPDNVFLCLGQLHTLRLSLGKLFNFSQDSLMGLTNLKHLDLTNSLKICTSDLVNVLSNKISLPKLSRLTLDGTGTFCTYHFKVNQELVDLLASRRIQDINFSSTKIEFENFNVTKFCNYITTLNFSNSWILHYQFLDKTQICRSLTQLDMNRFHIYFIINFPIHINVTNFPPVKFKQPPIFSHVKTLFLNNILSDNHDIYIRNTSFTYTAENSLEELHLCGYNLINFDAELKLTYDSLKLLNMSNNKLRNIGQKVFRNLKFLRQIDLGNNRLSETHLYDQILSKLFNNNLLLKEINLANNGLQYLPKGTFSFNLKLTEITLNQNRFQQINFNITHLSRLKFLDLRNNSIEFLNAFSRDSLDKLYNTQAKTQTNQEGYKFNKTKFVVDLRGNPFSCRCEALSFLSWFASSPLFSSTRHLYYCQINDKRLTMDEGAVNAAKEDCEEPKRRKRKIVLASTLSLCGASVWTLGIFFLVKMRKKMRRQKHIEERIRLLDEGEAGFQFIVFLSFSSEDDNVVQHHVLDPLKRCLEEKTGINRELVCVADRHFRPGRTIFAEMIKCLEDSAIFVAVVSRSFCKSDYCKRETEEAHLKRMPIILIFIEEVEVEQMSRVIQEVFQHFTRVKLVYDEGQFRLQPDIERVCDSIMLLL